MMIKLKLTLLITSVVFVAFNSDGQELLINELMSSNASTSIAGETETFDWIEIYNTSENPMDLTGYGLTHDLDSDNPWLFGSTVIAANGYIIIRASGMASLSTPQELHASFSIDADGEEIYLISPTSAVIDQSPSRSLGPDISIGRMPGNQVDWFYFEESTPGSSNTTEAYSSVALGPDISHEPGLYSDAFTLSHQLAASGDVIRYTLDYSIPNSNSPILPGALEISDNSILRLISYREDALPSQVLTYSFIIQDDLELDVISLVSATSNLFGSNGIYSNYSSGDEKPIHLEFFGANTGLEFKSDLGVKIHAPDSRDQKSLRLYARAEYGNAKIEYPIFENRPYSTYSTLVLRNAGNDGLDRGETHIRDPFSHKIWSMDDPDHGYSAYKPVNVFINGEYWGIYNLRERQDSDYMESCFGLAAEEVDFLEYDYAEPLHKKIISGNWDDWEALKSFLIDEDISVQANYEVAKNWIDIENYIDYMIYEIYIGNQDWCNNNIKFYKPYAEGGKWRFVLWDTEYGLGTFETFPIGQPTYNFFNMAMTWCGWGSGNYSWMISNLMENVEFRDQFLTRTQDLLNTSFKKEFLIDEFNALAQTITSDSEYHFDRWGGNTSEWNESRGHTLYFIEERATALRANMSEALEFGTEEFVLDLDLSHPEAGYLDLNTITLDEHTLGWNGQAFPWEGIYLDGQVVKLKAHSHLGYEFSHWEGDITSTESEIMFTQVSDLTIHAIYEVIPLEDLFLENILINELMASNEASYADQEGEFDDWIELYNTGQQAVDLAGLYLSDDSTEPFKWKMPYEDPSMTTIGAMDHLLLFADKDVEDGVLHTNFKLDSDGEEVGLYFKDSEGNPVLLDNIIYDPILTDKSYGRNGDGNENWVIFEASNTTPDTPNELISAITESSIVIDDLNLYPNPVSNFLNVDLQNIQAEDLGIMIYTLKGELVRTSSIHDVKRARIAVGDLQNGIYLLLLHDKWNKVLANTQFIVKH